MIMNEPRNRRMILFKEEKATWMSLKYVNEIKMIMEKIWF